MELAVLKYEDSPSPPQGIPGEWPYEVREIANGAALPGASWVRMTLSEFTAHKAQYQSAYNTWWASVSQPTAHAVVQGKVLAAMEFGRALVADFLARNVIAGLTDSQLFLLASNASLLEIQSLLLNGSVRMALLRIEELDPVMDGETVLISQAVLDEYAQKIRTYLGI